MISVASARRLVMMSAAGMLSVLGGCVQMPHPFRHDGTGATAQAPTARLAVPLSTASGTDMAGAQQWQHAMVDAMLAQSVPAMGQAVHTGDWWLKMTATFHDNAVTPVYAVITPKGEERGHLNGAPVPAVRWQAKDGQAVTHAAQEAAPGVADLLTGIRAAQMQKDPNSLKNRPAHVYFAGVHDAPGDGDRALARAFIAAFPDAQEDIRHSASGADYTVRCMVVLNNAVMSTSTTPQQHITLTWQVLDAQGKEAGSATQIHDIAAHSLDRQWGDVAIAAADEAAGAVRQIITRYSGRANAPLPADGALSAHASTTPPQPVAGPAAGTTKVRGVAAKAVPAVAAGAMPVVPPAPVAAQPAPPVALPSSTVMTPEAGNNGTHPVVERPVSPVVSSPAAPLPVAAPPVPVQPTPAPAPAPAPVASQPAPMPAAPPVATSPAVPASPAPVAQPARPAPFPGVTLPPARTGVTDRQRGAGVQASPVLGR